jgi:hypothetical protein
MFISSSAKFKVLSLSLCIYIYIYMCVCVCVCVCMYVFNYFHDLMYHVSCCLVSKDSSSEHFHFLVHLIWSKWTVVGLVLAWQCPSSLGTCNPQETGLPGLPMSWPPPPPLFSRSDPVGLPPVLWTEKTIERSPFLVRHGGHWCRGGLVGRTNFCFFWVTCKR